MKEKWTTKRKRKHQRGISAIKHVILQIVHNTSTSDNTLEFRQAMKEMWSCCDLRNKQAMMNAVTNAINEALDEIDNDFRKEICKQETEQ